MSAPSSTTAPVVVEQKQPSHNDWIVPRRVMCAFFWIGIVLLFTGIILLVTSKHKGGAFQSWGAIMLGLGFCLLLICLILCLHAYCVITITDDRPRVEKTLPASPPTTKLMNGRKPMEYNSNTATLLNNGGFPNGRRMLERAHKPLQVIVIEKDKDSGRQGTGHSPNKLSHSGTLLTDSRMPVQTVIPPGGLHTDHHVECQIPVTAPHNSPPDGASSSSASCSPPEGGCQCSRPEGCPASTPGLPSVASGGCHHEDVVNGDALSAREIVMAQDNEVNTQRDSLQSQPGSSKDSQISSSLPLMWNHQRVNTNTNTCSRSATRPIPNGDPRYSGNHVRLSSLTESNLLYSRAPGADVRPNNPIGRCAHPGDTSLTDGRAPHPHLNITGNPFIDFAMDSNRDSKAHGQGDLHEMVVLPGGPANPIYSTPPTLLTQPFFRLPGNAVRAKPPAQGPCLGPRLQRGDFTVRHGVIHPIISPMPPRSVFTNIPPQDDHVHHPRPTRLPVGQINPEVHPQNTYVSPSSAARHAASQGNQPPMVVYLNPMECSESKMSIYDNVQYAWTPDDQDPEYVPYTQGNQTFCDI